MKKLVVIIKRWIGNRILYLAKFAGKHNLWTLAIMLLKVLRIMYPGEYELIDEAIHAAMVIRIKLKNH